MTTYDQIMANTRSRQPTLGRVFPSPYEEIEGYLKQAEEEIASALLFTQNTQKCVRPTSYPKFHAKYRHHSKRDLNKYDGRVGGIIRDAKIHQWSDNILKDFQSLVQKEIQTLTMGANQSQDGWVVDSPFRTYTLPRSNRSVSLMGPGTQNAHPDDRQDTCRLLRVNRFSRSHSVDAGTEGLAALALLIGANEDVPEKTRKVGLTEKDNEPWQYINSFVDNNTDPSTGYTTDPTFDTNSITSGGSALTAEVLGEPSINWAWVDDDAPEYTCPLLPTIVVDKIHDTSFNDIHEFSAPNPMALNAEIHNKRTPNGGRKSEPTLSLPVSPVLTIPGLELRRHTIPTTDFLDVPPQLIFNTSSWDTLPPAEEMEVMEDKPIGKGEDVLKERTMSRSLNSSLSSISQLSVLDSDSEYLDTLSQDLCPEVFLDPAKMLIEDHKEFSESVREQRVGDSLSNEKLSLNNSTELDELEKSPEQQSESLSHQIIIQTPGAMSSPKCDPNSPGTVRSEVITGRLQLSRQLDCPGQIILSVSIPDPSTEGSHDSKINGSVNSILSELEKNPKTKSKDVPKSNGTKKCVRKKRSFRGPPVLHKPQTFADLQDFLKQVENRIPCHSPESQSSTVDGARSGVSLDVCTQTSPPPTCCSSPASFTWMSDCEGVSLEPCASSAVLTEDDFDEDVWSDNMSSSSPQADSSFSLSESLDHLDHVESGIGTVSTRPSTSPPTNMGSLEFSLESSEDTGLENSFEKRIRRYQPNGKYRVNEHYRRKRQRSRQFDKWVRQENQTTQTELRDVRAVSEETSTPVRDPVRQTISEPKLSECSFSNLRVVCSEDTLPPVYPKPLPPLNEDSPQRGEHETKAVSAPALEVKFRRRNWRSNSTTTPPDGLTEINVKSLRTQSAKELSVPETYAGASWRSLSASSIKDNHPRFFRTLSYRVRRFGPRKRVERLWMSLRENRIAEIEAIEACKWLRAAGFPQYAQMYEDLQFPLDLASVERDHTFLDSDSIQALFRRLRILNRCARIRLDGSKKTKLDDSEEEDQECALSGNWQFQRHSRRWSRIDPTQLGDINDDMLDDLGPSEDSGDLGQFKRSSSERLRDGAKAFLRRMESLKTKKKRRHKDNIVIGSPKVQDESHMKARMVELGCVDISPTPVHRHSSSMKERKISSQSYQADSPLTHTRSRRRRRLWNGKRSTEHGAFSDSECSPPAWRSASRENKQKPDQLHLRLQTDEKPDKTRADLRHATSLTYGKESQLARQNFLIGLRGRTKARENVSPLHSPDDPRHSIYDNVPLIICNKTYYDFNTQNDVDMRTQEGSGSSECTMDSRESPQPSTQDDEEDERPNRRATIDRWHSFNRKSVSFSLAQHYDTHITAFSVGQMNHLRKRALLRLTALMERYCPTNRNTWNWELPKFMRKMKTPDYKDRLYFGVPLQVINQRIGQPLPPPILKALSYLRRNCLDQIGLFRKPGVKTRILRLRDMHETDTPVAYGDFCPFDIADMVKTYFRELPEVILTTKLSGIFITICQYLPECMRLEALQCVMMMMPDENREALMVLLTFLAKVAASSHLNQMTANNLSVCMAPSLFHLNLGNPASSPLRRRGTGTPEHKDLHDNKASHQCLTLMIQQVSELQCVPTEMLSNCRFSYLDNSQPVSLDDLGSSSTSIDGDWSSYMNACVKSLLKETKDKNKGWVHVSYPDSYLDLWYRKVADGHPLRLWKVTTEVEAPPTELLTRILRERHLWDENLLKWRVVSKLGKQAEVFQFMSNSMSPRPAIDFSVLRCWRTDLGRGVCVVVETSVEHPDAPILTGCLRGIVLASRYMIQPCGSGKSRVTHISRIDLRGRLPEWYNKTYPSIAALHVTKLRDSFQHVSTGPESNV